MLKSKHLLIYFVTLEVSGNYFLYYYFNNIEVRFRMINVQGYNLNTPDYVRKIPQGLLAGNQIGNYTTAPEQKTGTYGQVPYYSDIKTPEHFRDTTLDGIGKAVTEEIPSYGTRTSALANKHQHVKIIDLTGLNTSAVDVRPFGSDYSVYKPHLTIQLDKGFKGLFKWCCAPDGGDIAREIGARQLAKMLGMEKVVPKTMFAKVKTPDYGERVGSLQEFVEDAQHIMDNKKLNGELLAKVKSSPAAMQDLRQIVLFNHIARNNDTGLNNWLVKTENGKVTGCVSIDHATTGLTPSVTAIADQIPELATIELTDAEKQSFRKFLARQDRYSETLKQFYPETSTKEFFKGVEALLKEGALRLRK